MASIQGYVHRDVDAIFLPSKPPKEIEVGDEVTVRQAARALGVDAETIRGLIEDGVLETSGEDSDAIDGTSFARFLGGLRSVELVPRERKDAAPRGGRGRLALDEAEDDADDAADEHPSEWEADCPGCGTRLSIAEGVHSFDCPECKRRIVVAEASDEKDRERNPRRMRRHIHIHRR